MELFDIKEDEMSEAPFRSMNSDHDCQHSLHPTRIDVYPEKNSVGLLSCSRYAYTESGCDNASKLDTLDADDFDKSAIVNLGGASDPVHDVDKSFRLASDADVTVSGRILSDVEANNASCDERPSDDCAGDFNLGGEGEEVAFDPDYVSYCGKHYTDSRVSFSSIRVEVWSKDTYEDGQTLRIALDIEDIVKIESQWSARFKIGTITISFILKDEAKDSGDDSSSASGIQELVFPAADIDWYEKLEAIESLDEKYRALWNVILDTGMDQPALPEQNHPFLTRTYFPNFDDPFEEVIYPQGDPDAVSISKRDVEVLLPDTFLNDTIIDFYIKYLKTKQNTEQKMKFHFFNSFFFRKLADVDKDPSSVLDGRAAFLRVRKWTRKVKLDEKDFIFIPVNYVYHWSLIVICYFAEVSNYTDSEGNKSPRVPCILHMDSLRGTHAGLKDLFQSYLLEEWKERHGELCDDVDSKFRNLKFVSLELPQQQNAYDCGLFLLHYVELFLEGVPPNFSIYNVTACSKFLQSDWFPPEEASMKRTHIERLISSLINSNHDNLSPGDGKEHSSEELQSSHRYQNDAMDPSNSHCWRDEGRLNQAGQGIEMTLLPSPSKINQSTRTSGLVLCDLLQPTIGPHAFDGSAWGAFGNRLSVEEIKRPPILPEADDECLISEERTEPFPQQLNDLAPATSDPNSSGDFLLEDDRVNSLNGTGSSPSASEMLSAQQTHSYQDNPPKSCQETDQLEASLISPVGYITSSTSDEQQVLKRRCITGFHQNGGDGLLDEQRASKRIRSAEDDLNVHSCPQKDAHQ